MTTNKNPKPNYPTLPADPIERAVFLANMSPIPHRWDDPNGGDLAGVVLDKRTYSHDQYGTYPVLIVGTATGDIVSAACFHTLLRTFAEGVEPGGFVAIASKGTKIAASGMTYTDYGTGYVPPSQAATVTAPTAEEPF